MLAVEELIQASKTYERDYDWHEEGFEWCLDVGEECGGDPWKIADRKLELEGIQVEASKRRNEEWKANGPSSVWLGMDDGWKARWQENHLELYLAMMWAKPLGLWPTRAHERASKHVAGLDAVQLYNCGREHSFFDHIYYFREGSGRLRAGEQFVIVSHPYGVADKFKQAAGEWSAENGALVEYPKFPSWWKPAEYDADGELLGGTTLVVWKWMQNGEEIRRLRRRDRDRLKVYGGVR